MASASAGRRATIRCFRSSTPTRARIGVAYTLVRVRRRRAADDLAMDRRRRPSPGVGAGRRAWAAQPFPDRAARHRRRVDGDAPPLAGTTKVLASVTLAGALLLLVLFTLRRADWHGEMFASQWFVVFLPMVVFWAGAWLRRRHGKIAWSVAAVLLAFSLGGVSCRRDRALAARGFHRRRRLRTLHRGRRAAEPDAPAGGQSIRPGAGGGLIGAFRTVVGAI